MMTMVFNGFTRKNTMAVVEALPGQDAGRPRPPGARASMPTPSLAG